MAKLIRIDQTISEVTPKSGLAFEVSEVQQIIGGQIKTMALKNATEILVFSMDSDQAGENEIATNLAGLPMNGDVLICEAVELVTDL